MALLQEALVQGSRRTFLKLRLREKVRDGACDIQNPPLPLARQDEAINLLRPPGRRKFSNTPASRDFYGSYHRSHATTRLKIYF